MARCGWETPDRVDEVLRRYPLPRSREEPTSRRTMELNRSSCATHRTSETVVKMQSNVRDYRRRNRFERNLQLNSSASNFWMFAEPLWWCELTEAVPRHGSRP